DGASRPSFPCSADLVAQIDAKSKRCGPMSGARHSHFRPVAPSPPRGSGSCCFHNLPSVRRFLLSPHGWPYALTPFIPLAIALDIAGAAAGLVFAASAIGIVLTAALMGRATEELAARSGPGIGGLLNVTFGNAPELIIALFALGNGLHEVVKASIVGSIVGNILLVMGAAMLAGGLGRDKQK